MNSKKQYYALDDIGFVGVQDNRSPAEIKEDERRTIKAINALKAAEKRKKTPSRKRVVKTR